MSTHTKRSSPAKNLLLCLAANVDFTVYQKVAVVQKRGQEYLKLLETKTDIEIGDAVTHLDGLHGGDDTLGKRQEKMDCVSALTMLRGFSESNQ